MFRQIAFLQWKTSRFAVILLLPLCFGLPILLVRVGDTSDAGLVRECLQAQEYWRLKGLVADLVVINEHPPGYIDEVHAEGGDSAGGRAP